MRIGDREFDTRNQLYVMGILNVTPDSFSDGGRWDDVDKALAHAEQMADEGVDIIDVGGESTRPGYTKIADGEEIRRIVPVIEAVKKRLCIPLSVDTCKGAVAKAALDSGADMINDVRGLKADPEMAGIIAEYGVACCLMHNRDNTDYADLIGDIKSELLQSVEIARNAGVPQDKIVIDPGVGFGKTYEQNLRVIARLDEFGLLGYPVLLGASRKSVIARTLGLPPDERLEGTLVTTVFAAVRNAAFVRVHDVKENIRAAKMAKAILNSVK